MANANAAEVKRYVPATLHAFGGELPLLVHDWKQQPDAWHGFLPRESCTEAELDLLEAAGVFSSEPNISRELFIGLQMILPKERKEGQKDWVELVRPELIDQRVCASIYEITNKMRMAGIRDGIPPLLIKRSLFRELVRNFYKLNMKIELHSFGFMPESLPQPQRMYFVVNSVIFQIVPDDKLLVPDYWGDVQQIAKMSPISLEPDMMKARAIPAPFPAMSQTIGIDRTWVVTQEYQVMTLFDFLKVGWN